MDEKAVVRDEKAKAMRGEDAEDKYQQRKKGKPAVETGSVI
jgi:hypothetical protein